MKKGTPYERMKKGFMGRVLRLSLSELNPARQFHNPVMLLVYLAFLAALISCLRMAFGIGDIPEGSLTGMQPGRLFVYLVTGLLLLQVYCGCYAKAAARELGSYQADLHRTGQKAVMVSKMMTSDRRGNKAKIPSTALRRDDYVYVSAGEIIPADGVVAEGTASVDESAITGESAPVVREQGAERSSVTGGTMVISDWLVIRITSNPGENFLDRMSGTVEAVTEKKTVEGRRLQFLLEAVSGAALLVTLFLYLFTPLLLQMKDCNDLIWQVCLAGTFVCLMPTTIAALGPAVMAGGMFRLHKANVVAMSSKAVEAAGRVDILLLDKTGTITLGNRKAWAFLPVGGTTVKDLADAAQLASMADETPEGRSIVVLAKEEFGIRGRSMEELQAEFVPFSVKTRMSGIDYQGHEIRKGAADRIRLYVESGGGMYSQACEDLVNEVAGRGSTPLVVARNRTVLGVVELKDTLKDGITEKCASLRRMGIRTIMLTGDNPLTAAFIAAEAGVDDFLAEATPEAKLTLVRDYQATGHRVAMTGDGDNDAPALAQADVAVAMNTGTAAAREACNMIDLDSSPTKLIEIVGIGRQIRQTRSALLLMSAAQTAAIAVLLILTAYGAGNPALFSGLLGMEHSIYAVILSVLLCNALMIPLFLPVALKGIRCRERSAAKTYAGLFARYAMGGAVLFVPVVQMMGMIWNMI